MLPKQYRLKKRYAFNATYRTGKSFHRNGLTVFCGKKKNIEIPTKIGFVVSKKIHKRAVIRNRIKRLMRESVRLYIKKHQGLDIQQMSLIFVASTKLIEKDFADINLAVNKLLNMVKNA